MINIVVLLLSTALFSKNPSIALLIPVLTLIGTLVEQERRACFQNLCESDKKLFEMLQENLPTGHDAIQFLKNHDMGGSYSRVEFKPLADFQHYWSTPDHEFVNRKLEHKRKLFMKSLGTFLDKLGQESTPHSIQKDCYQIVSHEDDYGRYTRVRDELNNLSNAAYDSFCDLVRTGRKMI